jgi:predicted nucleic acid-binding protein
MRAVFVDTGAFYAALNRHDRNHRAAVGLFGRAVEEEWRLLTSNFVVAETHALILTRLGHDFAVAWLRSLPAVILRISRDDEQQAIRIIVAYRDKDFSYCDATSFALIERFRIRSAMSFDRHFRQYGKFELLAQGHSLEERRHLP